jgi:hypothetical protein
MAMSIQQLTHAAAFSSGAELWFLPNPAVSRWARKLDWYLNFQMARTAHRLPPVFELGLLELIKEENLALPTQPPGKGLPLLIATEHRLPTKQIVSLSFAGELKDWSTHCAETWTAMKKPPLRIFLPEGETFKGWRKHWKEEAGQDISVVGDAETGQEK